MVYRFMRFLFVCGTMLMFVSVIGAAEWNGIRPLHSTRSDVERIFGPNVRPCKTLWCIYNLKEETVWIQYASGPPCGHEVENAWKVPRDTVVEMNVRFKQERPLSELKFDLSKFVRTVDNHVIGWIYYTNRREGIEIEGNQLTASVINYFAEEKDYRLRCPRAEQGLEAGSPLSRFHSQLPQRRREAQRLDASHNFMELIESVADALRIIDSYDGPAEEFILPISEELLDPVGVNMAMIGDRILSREWEPNGFEQRLGYRIYRYKARD